MKKYILSLLSAGFAFGCQPVEENNQDPKEIQTEWKKKTEDAKALSKKLEENLRNWEAMYDNDSSLVADENSNCQSVGQTYKEMKISVQSFLDGSAKESVEVDRLINELENENWTEENENQLTSLKLAIDEKNAEIERWEYNLDSLQKICPTSAIPVIEK